MDSDKRFSKIAKDPRFKRMPRKARRVKIDSRFKSMFSDSKFKTKYSVDKRGRPIQKTSKEDLKKYYEIDEDNGNDELKPVQGDQEADESVSDSSDDDDIDFSDIRGGALSSSSDDDDDDDNDLDENGEEDIEHDWGELDKDAKRKVDAVTSRLAVCNMDWDKVNANDLFVLFSSFGGVIKSVKIYLSEFGKQRLAEEDLSGPIELKNDNKVEEEDEEEKGNNDEKENGNDSNNVEGSSFHMEKLRKYQLNRMKYYYAIVECHSKETANKIYENCDGIEYELAATRLDLRFVPDETEFDDEPKQVATELPMLNNYQPSIASNSALQQSTVRLTWDETDPRRLEMTMRKFNKDELADMDFKAYLATSSEEDEDDEVGRDWDNEKMDDDNGDRNEESKDEEDEKLNKYKALLQEIESKEKKDDEEQHMEISWEPALSESAEQIVKNKIEREQEKTMTPWEKYLKDKKKKMKSKGIMDYSDKEGIGKNDDNDDDDDDDELERLGGDEEDDYIPTGADDPFFAHSDEDNNKEMNENKKRKKKNKKRREQDQRKDKDEDAQERNELELLLMDDKEEKQHFNMKEIIENETKKKKRRKGKEGKAERIDEFEIDVQDTRFSALFNSPDYILDPSNPHFKKTKAMDKIIEEKQNRRDQTHKEFDRDANDARDFAGLQSRMNPSLSALVKSVKARTEQHQLKKKLKPKS